MSRILAFAATSYGTAKDATRRLLDAVGGIDRAAEACRVGRSQLSRCANPYDERAYLPLDAVLPLERAAGARPITEYLALSHGCVLTELPRGAQADRWAEDLALCAREGGEVIARLAAALADGAVTPREAVDLLRETDEALAAFALLRQHLAAKIEGGTA